MSRCLYCDHEHDEHGYWTRDCMVETCECIGFKECDAEAEDLVASEAEAA